MLTNYKVNQPLTSDFSVEKRREKYRNHGADRIVNHVETFFTQKPAMSVEGNKPSRSIVKANYFRAGHIFFLVPFKESRFPLFGISIQGGKRRAYGKHGNLEPDPDPDPDPEPESELEPDTETEPEK